MGFSLGEILLLVIVGIIVVGPKRLPGMMRTAGQWVARLRRMSTDLRSQSGIDDLLRQEGLDQHIHELRSLTRMNVVDTLMAPAPPRIAADGPQDAPSGKLDRLPLRPFTYRVDEPLREREYPLIGCDAGGALPDDATVYVPPPEPPADTASEPAAAAEAAGEPASEPAEGNSPASEPPTPDDGAPSPAVAGDTRPPAEAPAQAAATSGAER